MCIDCGSCSERAIGEVSILFTNGARRVVKGNSDGTSGHSQSHKDSGGDCFDTTIGLPDLIREQNSTRVSIVKRFAT